MIRNSLVKVKEAPPYTPDLESKVLMNSLARATLNPKTGSYAFTEKLAKKMELDDSNVKAVSEIIASGGLGHGEEVVGVGVDQGIYLRMNTCL